MFGKAFHYSYRPNIPPQDPHLYFRYRGYINSYSYWWLKRNLASNCPRFLHGATIAGVALQLAKYMGAREVNMYGVDMNNFDGHTYFDPKMNVGLTKLSHVRNFKVLLMQIRRLKVEVKFHGKMHY